MFMCNNAWSGSKSKIREVSKLKKQLITLVCLIIGTCTAGALASAAPVMSMAQPSVVERISEEAATAAAATAPVMDAVGGFKIRRAGRRAIRQALRNRGGLGVIAPLAPIIHVGGASSAKRAAERAVGGRAVRVVRQGRKFVVTVVSGGSAKRCIVDAQSGQVLGCR